MKRHIPGLHSGSPNTPNILEGVFLVRVDRTFYRWFLRDFGYNPDLMGRDEVDEKALVGLRGIVRISRTTLNGLSFLNLGGFAPASEWEELSVSASSNQEVAGDV